VDYFANLFGKFCILFNVVVDVVVVLAVAGKRVEKGVVIGWWENH
jgi:hypothetical protein